MAHEALPGQVELDSVTVQYGEFTAVRDVSLRVEQGEFFSFLGPSGCGKTTLLRAIAGFVDPTHGVIRIGGTDMRGVEPNRRPTALVFQSLALFPTMTVAENIAYGLRVRGVAKAARRARADRLLEMVALGEFGSRRVDDLSGGQRQRVAIARALAVEPSVLLLDEPLSALDLKLRQHMRRELRLLQREIGTTFIYITHDQSEALAMSDRVAVMRDGRIEQTASGIELYRRPASPFVAGFVGESNALRGRVLARDGVQVLLDTGVGPMRGVTERPLAVGDEAILFVRPESLTWDWQSEDNALPGKLRNVTHEGAATEIQFDTDTGGTLSAQLPSHTALALESGARVRFGFHTADGFVLPA
jgi:spermidine/putrescine transport system ATP-binding protein